MGKSLVRSQVLQRPLPKPKNKTMKTIGIIFPHQLFENSPLLDNCLTIYLVEENLLFCQFQFHKQKIAYHRASMKFYENHLLKLGKEVVYIEAKSHLSDIRELIIKLKEDGIEALVYIDPTDNWLEKRIQNGCAKSGMSARKLSNPLFINTVDELEQYFKGKRKMFQTDFYKAQRISRNILLEPGQKPVGGQWTFDSENRLKYPKGKVPPRIAPVSENQFFKEAISYTETHFKYNYGKLNSNLKYPSTFKESKDWLQDFLENRFSEFGIYEDALVERESILNHSVLTPMLNVGLITPEFVINQALSFASENEIPLNSLEGFIRQILGWREFIRAVYEMRGSEERTRNYWGFKRKIPQSFWSGTTGIEPIDAVIKKVIETGYCHHIERLMVLGNFMLLCEFHPDEVYRWFMEMFIDSYDWVMVPNVYGMSQFSDGGLMSTKPYISGSNYLMKMSDFKKGSWQTTWDGLFWRFMHVHRDFFLTNPRLRMLVASFDKMTAEKRNNHLKAAESYLAFLDN